jgi:hypothetical protein
MGFKLIEPLAAARIGHKSVGAVAAATFAAVASPEVVLGGKYHPTVFVEVVFVGCQARYRFFR